MSSVAKVAVFVAVIGGGGFLLFCLAKGLQGLGRMDTSRMGYNIFEGRFVNQGPAPGNAEPDQDDGQPPSA